MKWRAALALVVTLVACNDISSPRRSDFYEWRAFVGGDTLAFHWPSDSLPIRVWVKDTLNLPAHTEAALAAWEGAFLYHEFTSILTDDSARAHILVQVGSPPGDGVSIDAVVSECEASTYLALDPANRDLQLPVGVYVLPRLDPTREETQRCFGIVLLHEFGHAIGIFNHSSMPSDIMYSNPVADSLSNRDRTVAELVYHTRPTINLIGGSF